MNAPVSLKALAESKADGIQKATTFKVRPDAVEFEVGFNLRDEGPELDAHIDQLEAAMRAGAHVPAIDLSVVDGRMIVRDGHCRTRAARRIEGYMLEARQVRGNEADAVFHMLGSAQGKAFTPLEQGRGFLRLVRYGHEVADIAKKTGLHRSTIENGLALAEAPVAVQSMVAEGKVSSSLALQTVREHGPKATEKLEAAVKTAEASGKKKATAKHVEPKPRGQTLPPKEKAPAKATPCPAPDNRLQALAERLAAVNIIVSHIDRAAIVALVTEARAIVGAKS